MVIPVWTTSREGVIGEPWLFSDTSTWPKLGSKAKLAWAGTEDLVVCAPPRAIGDGQLSAVESPSCVMDGLHSGVGYGKMSVKPNTCDMGLGAGLRVRLDHNLRHLLGLLEPYKHVIGNGTSLLQALCVLRKLGIQHGPQ